MKDGIHPEYVECTITCTCGAVYHTRSTKATIQVQICASCHPVFTGQQKLVDTAGRVEKFRRKYTQKTPSKPAS
jgi:large subunit ribosomal protein L31